MQNPELNNVSFDLNEQFISNIIPNFMFHGIDHIYSAVVSFQAYDFKVWYFWFMNSFFDDSFDFFFFSYWYFSLFLSSFQLFWAIILDLYLSNSLIKFPFTEDWYKTLLSSTEGSLLLVYHPDLLFLKALILNNNYLNYFSSLYYTMYNYVESESFFSPILLLPQLIFLIFLSVIFISFYFSYFNSAVKEEVTIDSDYLVNSATVEAEKELSALDDIILAFVILFYIFGWYFYINCWSLLSMMPELVMVFYLFPMLYYIIIGIPTFLIYDFGIYFLVYLRGAGKSKLLFVELVQDYIAVIIFYTRILVQGVRLVLMIFTYAGLHDTVLFFSFGQNMFLSYENFSEYKNSVGLTLDTLSYYFLFVLPGKFLYLIYEILHTYFVVTVQFAAFFAIVFWLFLFLYTFFVLEKQENYFKEKRVQRANFYNYLYILKN